MEATSKVLSIIAYYLSEYDMDAVKALGYQTRSEAMKAISVAAGRDNNYLKLRRDEFDALPESSSSRKGWRNRAPLKEVEELGTYLHTFSFDELTEIVKSLIAGFDDNATTLPQITHSIKADDLSEEELEQIINFSDPNATEVMRDYIERNFVSKGMCAQFAIHDSENKETGQRNLHCHILLTMRGIDEQGQWMPKQKKVYLTDEQGERIPIIDKKTSQQKVDKQNRKQWKCKTVDTNDWNNRENAKIWRRDLADTINAVNQRIGETENFWEHRSFKEQGLDIEPQIHLGEKASAMERAGIHTIRGDINRRILANNAVIEQAKATYIHAKNALEAVKVKSQTVIQAVKNEILDMIRIGFGLGH